MGMGWKHAPFYDDILVCLEMDRAMVETFTLPSMRFSPGHVDRV
jgi:hypothetical protein